MDHVSVRFRICSRTVIAVALLLPFAWCIGSTICGANLFAYRDSITFYYPNYRWASQQWAGGDMPLWNPQMHLGVPVVADATSAVFYPGKLVYLLPVDHILRFNLYVDLHLLWAAAATFVLGRFWHMSRPAAGLCAIAYALSGAVLFQYCNVVFLVGAAWLPVAVLATDQLLRGTGYRWAVLLGMSWACMILGGDPQAVYHSGLIGLWGLIVRRREPVDSSTCALPRATTPPCQPSLRWGLAQPAAKLWARWRWLRPRICGLGLAAALAFLLSAVQIVPAAQRAQDSRRAVFERPRSIYEIPEFLLREKEEQSKEQLAAGAQRGTAKNHDTAGVLAGIFGSPVEATHHKDLYDFSVEPWRMVETLWPNFSGRLFPRNRRWLSVLGAEGRIWVPSLYAGLAPLLLALSVFQLRTRLPTNPVTASRSRWMSWVLLWSVLGSWGMYGLGAAINELARWGGGYDSTGLGAPTGGVYWLMVTLLPGYVYFRYPAKLLVVASLGLSVLAGWGLDQVVRKDRARPRRAIGWVAVFSLVVGLGIAGWQPLTSASWTDWESGSDELFGPFQSSLAQRDAIFGCLHAAVVAGWLWWLFGRRSLRPSVVKHIVLCTTALDLAVANGGLVLTAPADALRAAESQQVAELCRQAADPNLPPRITRIYRRPDRSWVPEKWRRTTSSRRASEVLSWDCRSSFPNYHLLGETASLTAQSSIAPVDLAALHRVGVMDLPHPSLLNLWGVEWVLLPAQERPPAAAGWLRVDQWGAENLAVWQNPHAFPRVWIVHQVDTLPILKNASPRAIAQRAREIVWSKGQPRDFAHSAVVELRPGESLHSNAPPVGIPDLEVCCIQESNPQCVSVDVELQRPGLLVLSDQWHPGWIALVQNGDQPPFQQEILRANGGMRGVWLSSGRHQVTFHFVPRRFYCAWGISSAAWCSCLGIFAVMLVRRHKIGRRRRSESRANSSRSEHNI
jgi:hypothetical protein